MVRSLQHSFSVFHMILLYICIDMFCLILICFCKNSWHKSYQKKVHHPPEKSQYLKTDTNTIHIFFKPLVIVKLCLYSPSHNPQNMLPQNTIFCLVFLVILMYICMPELYYIDLRLILCKPALIMLLSKLCFLVYGMVNNNFSVYWIYLKNDIWTNTLSLFLHKPSATSY